MLDPVQDLASKITFVEISDKVTATLCGKTPEGLACITASVSIPDLTNKGIARMEEKLQRKLTADERGFVREHAVDAARIIAARRIGLMVSRRFVPVASTATVGNVRYHAGTRGIMDTLASVAKIALPTIANIVAPGSGSLVAGGIDLVSQIASGVNPPAAASIVKDASQGNPAAQQALALMKTLEPLINPTAAQKQGLLPAGSQSIGVGSTVPVVVINVGPESRVSTFTPGAQPR